VTLRDVKLHHVITSPCCTWGLRSHIADPQAPYFRFTLQGSPVQTPYSPPHSAIISAGLRRAQVAMTIIDLPAIMGTVLIIAGLVLVGIYTRIRTAGSEKSVQTGALLIVLGAVLLGLSLFVPHAK
jgi:hypothetical protein